VWANIPALFVTVAVAGGSLIGWLRRDPPAGAAEPPPERVGVYIDHPERAVHVRQKNYYH
jgi:hypothetical protein